ncbi:hypothetical protein EAH79_12225 [Sphingomonas koreensis]|nr:hypothetical protein EAH79_12225 [Sphingomonas koreensis]
MTAPVAAFVATTFGGRSVRASRASAIRRDSAGGTEAQRRTAKRGYFGSRCKSADAKRPRGGK